MPYGIAVASVSRGPHWCGRLRSFRDRHEGGAARSGSDVWNDAATELPDASGGLRIHTVGWTLPTMRKPSEGSVGDWGLYRSFPAAHAGMRRGGRSGSRRHRSREVVGDHAAGTTVSGTIDRGAEPRSAQGRVRRSKCVRAGASERPVPSAVRDHCANGLPDHARRAPVGLLQGSPKSSFLFVDCSSPLIGECGSERSRIVPGQVHQPGSTGYPWPDA